jgi:acyl carrier protein
MFHPLQPGNVTALQRGLSLGSLPMDATGSVLFRSRSAAATSSAAAAGAAPLDLASVTHVVNTAVQRVLGRGIAPDAPLMAAGLDSLGATEVHASLQQATRLELPPTLIFDYPTCEALASHLHSQMVGAAGAHQGRAGGAGLGRQRSGGMVGMKGPKSGQRGRAGQESQAVAVVGASSGALAGAKGTGPMLR